MASPKTSASNPIRLFLLIIDTTVNLYCDQPFVSETTRCVSVDFIQTIDDYDKKKHCAFMCEGWKGVKS